MILCIGLNPMLTRRVIINDLVKGRTYLADNMSHMPEGGGVDIAKIVSDFNESVFLIGFQGGDNGNYIQKFLNNKYIDNNLVKINDETKGSISIVSNDGSDTKISEISPRISGLELEQFYNIYKNALGAANIVCLSGEAPRGIEDYIYEDLTLLAKENNKKIFVNSQKENLSTLLKQEPYLINIKLEDLINMTYIIPKNDKDIIGLASGYLDGDIKVITIEKDNGEYIVLNNNIAYIVTSTENDLINIEGSVEAYFAGFAVGEIRDYDFEYKLRIAVASYISNGLEYESGLVDMKKMKQLMNTITIETIEI